MNNTFDMNCFSLISWTCRYPGCGWVISKRWREGMVEFLCRVDRHAKRHEEEEFECRKN